MTGEHGRHDEKKPSGAKSRVDKDSQKDLDEKSLEDLRPGEDAGDVKGGARKGRYPGRTEP